MTISAIRRLDELPPLSPSTEKTLAHFCFPQTKKLEGSIATYQELAQKIQQLRNLQKKSVLEKCAYLIACFAMALLTAATFALGLDSVKNLPPRQSGLGEAEGVLFVPFVLSSYGFYKACSQTTELFTSNLASPNIPLDERFFRKSQLQVQQLRYRLERIIQRHKRRNTKSPIWKWTASILLGLVQNTTERKLILARKDLVRLEKAVNHLLLAMPGWER